MFRPLAARLREGADAGAGAWRVARVALQEAEDAGAAPHRRARLDATHAAQLALLFGAGDACEGRRALRSRGDRRRSGEVGPARCRRGSSATAAAVLACRWRPWQAGGGSRRPSRAGPRREGTCPAPHRAGGRATRPGRTWRREPRRGLQARAWAGLGRVASVFTAAAPFKELIGLGREAAVEHAERALADLLVQRDDGLLDAVAEAVAPDEDVASLPEPVDPPRRLHLLRRLWRWKSGESSTMGRVEVGCEGRGEPPSGSGGAAGCVGAA